MSRVIMRRAGAMASLVLLAVFGVGSCRTSSRVADGDSCDWTQELSLAAEDPACAGDSEVQRLGGYDPALEKPRVEEGIVATKAQAALGIVLDRGHQQVGSDWICRAPCSWKTVDALTTGKAVYFKKQWQNGKWNRSLEEHLLKYDLVLIDISDLRGDPYLLGEVTERLRSIDLRRVFVLR